jgi:hypothetical protein
MSEVTNELKHRRTTIQVVNNPDANEFYKLRHAAQSNDDTKLKGYLKDNLVIEEKKLLDKQQQTVDTSSKFSTENACWFVAAVLSTYASNMHNVLFYDDRVYR